ncbi:MAG: sortase, partial [Anaerolineae bacterium]|nr:sortase [Anaerolineae bacterium]
PTLSGNSVISAHVYLADGLPGPFLHLDQLGWGNQVIIHAFKQVYIYEVRSVSVINPNDISAVVKHEDRPWLTLLTCKDYNERTGLYDKRLMVKAVLMKVEVEK